MDKLEANEGGANTFGAQNRAACDNYQCMRDGENYQKPTAQTRAQVGANLKERKCAGLDRFFAGEQTPDTSGQTYRVAFQDHQQLRQN
ncbi:hypothetical protein GH769_00360 [Pseudomonas sp. CFSAN084952]|uniref:hypothetical protein n=1 Tax=Pseudomonas sp. CFSAN084952 TaxID=2664899 RepID=UPI001299A7AE|nr:hypothetical protein [Pseudomonas sp. CFSAN084952]QGF91742.1 hypothetical protein GH769_00360 [Pseudomonas sp. CFSAN084952]